MERWVGFFGGEVPRGQNLGPPKRRRKRSFLDEILEVVRSIEVPFNLESSCEVVFFFSNSLIILLLVSRAGKLTNHHRQEFPGYRLKFNWHIAIGRVG